MKSAEELSLDNLHVNEENEQNVVVGKDKGDGGNLPENQVHKHEEETQSKKQAIDDLYVRIWAKSGRERRRCAKAVGNCQLYQHWDVPDEAPQSERRGDLAQAEIGPPHSPRIGEQGLAG